MANKTVLQIVRSVARRIGIGEPNAATGSTDVQIKQLVALANQEGQELAARRTGGWTALINECTFSAIAAEDQGAIDGTILPATAGFSHILNDTIWNRTTRMGPGGPLSPRAWQAIKATTQAGPWSQYRIRGGHLFMYPAPAASDTLAFEYVGENWVSNDAEDETRSEFTQDGDFPLLDSRLIEMGTLWRWKSAKGLEFSQDFQNYENAVADAMARDGTQGTVRLDGDNSDDYRPYIIVPKGSWDL